MNFRFAGDMSAADAIGAMNKGEANAKSFIDASYNTESNPGFWDTLVNFLSRARSGGQEVTVVQRPKSSAAPLIIGVGVGIAALIALKS